ncbi:unnamed protein product, partial [Effrenium voratum]
PLAARRCVGMHLTSISATGDPVAAGAAGLGYGTWPQLRRRGRGLVGPGPHDAG